MAAKTEMVICDPSCTDPAKTKVIGKVVLNEDGKLIDTGQIIIAQELQECKNDIYVMMVSWCALCHFRGQVHHVREHRHSDSCNLPGIRATEEFESTR